MFEKSSMTERMQPMTKLPPPVVSRASGGAVSGLLCLLACKPAEYSDLLP